MEFLKGDAEICSVRGSAKTFVFASGRTASAEGDASYPDLPGCLLSAFHHGRFSGSFCFVETAVYRGRPY